LKKLAKKQMQTSLMKLRKDSNTRAELVIPFINNCEKKAKAEIKAQETANKKKEQIEQIRAKLAGSKLNNNKRKD
jgi:hypothetical protein